MQEVPALFPTPITDDIYMVPCFIQRDKNNFLPLCTPFSTEIEWDTVNARHAWNSLEDENLTQLTLEKGKKAWTSLARELNLRVHRGLPIRQGKQCRERYYNHLDPGLKKEKWTPEEDLTLINVQKVLGNKWSKIAEKISGRTENQIKNRFHSLYKKGLRGCPGGTSPLDYLINEKLKVELPRTHLLSPTSSFSPYRLSDFGFSTMVDRIKFVGVPEQSKPEATPSPSTMLFFHGPSS